MTPLRQRMVEDMRVRNLSANTQRAHLQRVGAFAKHFGRSPATLGPEEIRAWQLHLVEVRQLARSSLVTATAALRFLYTVTLKRDWAVDDIVMSKQPRTGDPESRGGHRFLRINQEPQTPHHPDGSLRRRSTHFGSDATEGQ